MRPRTSSRRQRPARALVQFVNERFEGRQERGANVCLRDDPSPAFALLPDAHPCVSTRKRRMAMPKVLTPRNVAPPAVNTV